MLLTPCGNWYFPVGSFYKSVLSMKTATRMQTTSAIRKMIPADGWSTTVSTQHPHNSHDIKNMIPATFCISAPSSVPGCLPPPLSSS